MTDSREVEDLLVQVERHQVHFGNDRLVADGIQPTYANVLLNKAVTTLRALVAERDELRVWKRDYCDALSGRECAGTCDSFGHDDECPAIHLRAAWAEDKAQLAAAQADVDDETLARAVASVHSPDFAWAGRSPEQRSLFARMGRAAIDAAKGGA